MSIIGIIQFLQAHSIVFMLVVFCLAAAAVFWPSRRERFERDARIPLDDGR